MLSVGVKDVAKFDYLERPPSDAIEGAVRQLTLLGAISGHQGAGQGEGSVASAVGSITEVGKLMGAFPLDPRFSKMLIKAKELECT